MNADQHERSSEEIRRDIDRTRAAMDETVDALENRLSPGQLVDQAWSMLRRQGGGAGDVVRDHPVPLALMGLGVAWLAIEKATGASHESVGAGTYARAEGRVGPYLGDAIHRDDEGEGEGIIERVKDGASGAADRVREAASGAAHGVGDAVSDAGDTLRSGARHARDRVRDARGGVRSFLDDSPLAAGAIAFGVGLAAGLSAPGTRLEDKLMGETADTVKREAKETAEEVGDRARSVASDTARAARAEADRQHIGDDLKESVRRIAATAKETAQERAREEDLTAEGMKERVREGADRVRSDPRRGAS